MLLKPATLDAVLGWKDVVAERVLRRPLGVLAFPRSGETGTGVASVHCRRCVDRVMEEMAVSGVADDLR
jgi:hypothetical protein